MQTERSIQRYSECLTLISEQLMIPKWIHIDLRIARKNHHDDFECAADRMWMLHYRLFCRNWKAHLAASLHAEPNEREIDCAASSRNREQTENVKRSG